MTLRNESPAAATSPTGVRSFASNAAETITLENGMRAHKLLADHLNVLKRTFYEVRRGVWSFVGNGLSNQSFVEGPEGIIAIDTGESNEEMRTALNELRAVTTKPVVAVLYTHFHYVGGTQEILDQAQTSLPIYGHERIARNRSRVSGEIGPAYSRGLVQQFGINLPADGPDGIVHVGLGNFFRSASHAPFTNGFVVPTHTFSPTGETILTVAGLQLHVTHAPSDADDSVTFWFPELSVCIQNLVWPTLFNIFAIRGEEYRDPQLLLEGLDHLLSLKAEHLVGAHGPPISGAADIDARVTKYRDAIAFLWDQTVRGINKGMSTDELATSIRLPGSADADYLTREHYGVAEHHVRQIHNGLRGWFDGDPAKLFPLPPAQRADRLIDGFGGRAVVVAQATDALANDDLRWATELASWLVASPSASAEDQLLLASVLRAIGERSPAANIRNWCITAARDLDSSASLARQRVHRFRRADVANDPVASLRVLRVLLDPNSAAGIDHHVAFVFDEGASSGGIHLRNSVAVPTNGIGAHSAVRLSSETWAEFLSSPVRWETLEANEKVEIGGDAAKVRALLSCFELPGRDIANGD